MAVLPLNDTQQEIKKDPLARKLLSVKRNINEWTFVWLQGLSKHTFKSMEPPSPDLINEFDKVLPYAVYAAPWLSGDYKDKTYVSEVRFDWKGDVERRNAIVIIGVTAKPIYIPTDKRLADNNQSEAKVARWETNAVAQFDKLEQRAFAYIEGERGQMELPIGKDKKEHDLDDEIGSEEN